MPEMKYSPQEHRRMGERLYDERIRSLVEEGNHGKFVLIDVDSGDFEVDEESLPAARRLLARHPDAQIWCIRIGYRAAVHFGGRTRGVKP